MNDERRRGGGGGSSRESKLDAMIEAALRERPTERLPKGFVSRTMERATGHPRFRLLPIDFALPVVVALLAVLAERIPIAIAAGLGPIWLRRALLRTAEAWANWSPLPPPPPAAGAVVLGCIVAITAAWVAGNSPASSGRLVRREN